MSQTVQTNRSSIWSTDIGLGNIEIADDNKRANLTIPLMHVGPNKKGVYWTEEMLKEVAPMFEGTTFRYDIGGQEGSSHTLNKLSSPHFDVGWVDEAWYDPKLKTLYVQGDVTHPEPLAKLERTTSSGKREINYASMGVLVDEYKCSICGHQPEVDCDHIRNEKYDGRTCYHIPVKVRKALHTALTNDPADGEADIEKCVFQELSAMDNQKGKKNQVSDDDQTKKGQPYSTQNGDNSSANDNMTANKFDNGAANVKKIQNSTNDKSVNNMNEQNSGDVNNAHTQSLSNQMPGGLAPSSPMKGQQGPAPSTEDILKDMAERIKTIELKQAQADQAQMAQPTPEVVNSASQTQNPQSNPNETFTQDGMGPQQDEQEADGMDVKDAQNSTDKTPVNPKKVETQDGEMAPASMEHVCKLLEQILARLPAAETQDGTDGMIGTSKGVAKNAKDVLPVDHVGEGAVPESESEGNKKNRENMTQPGKVATADMSEIAKLRKENAELKAGRAEFQDMDIPEFGGAQARQAAIEVADMGADGRRQKFGEFGAFEAIFKGTAAAERFKRAK